MARGRFHRLKSPQSAAGGLPCGRAVACAPVGQRPRPAYPAETPTLWFVLDGRRTRAPATDPERQRLMTDRFALGAERAETNQRG